MNSVGPVGPSPHAEKTLEPLEHMVHTQTDPAGYFFAVGTLSPSDCYPVGPVGPYVAGGPVGPDVYNTDPNSLTHMVRIPPDPDGQDAAATGVPSPSDCYPVGPDDCLPALESCEHLVLDHADPVGQHDADLDTAESLEYTVVENILDSRPKEGTTCPEHLALEVSLDSRLTEGASCLEPLEQLFFSSSLAARPVEGVTVKVLEGKPVIQPVQDSTPYGQPMEGTTYLEHPALGVSLDSRLREGMSHTETLEQSVLGEGSIVRPEAADMSEHHHKQTCFKLSARPMPDIDIVHNADVSNDINTDRPENSAPRNISDVNLFKCNPSMEGMTKSCQEELSGFELAVAGTDKEQLPTSYSLEQSESIISESQNYLKNTEETQFSYDTELFQSGIGRCYPTRGASEPVDGTGQCD